MITKCCHTISKCKDTTFFSNSKKSCIFANVSTERKIRKQLKIRRGAGVVDRGGLENR